MARLAPIAGTFHFSTHLFLSNAGGTDFVTNIELDHPQNHRVRLQPCPIKDNHFTLSVMLLNMRGKRVKVGCDTSVWFRDEEVLGIRNEEMVFEAGRWMQLGVIDLHDEMTELKEIEYGVLILAGEEEHIGEDFGHHTRSYMRVNINFVEVEESIDESSQTSWEEDGHSGRVSLFSGKTVSLFGKWALWTLLGFGIQAVSG